MNEEIKDKNEEIKDKHDDIEYCCDGEMVYERYKKLLCRMKDARDKKERCHDDEAEYERYKQAFLQIETCLAKTSYILQVLQEYIRETECEADLALSSLEFVSFHHGILTLRAPNNDMREILTTLMQYQEWSEVLEPYGVKTTRLLP